MRKQILALCLTAACSQQMAAQGFFKKLGKALAESAKEIVSGGMVTQETPWGNVTIKHLMPNMNITVQNVSRNGNDAVVTLLFTNTSPKRIAVWGLTDRKTFDSQGNEYSSRCQVGQEMLTIGDAYNFFEPDVPVKVYYIINNVPTSAFTLRLLKLGTYYDAGGSKTETPLEIRNITVPDVKVIVENTNKDNSQPTIRISGSGNTTTSQATTTTAKNFKGEWSNGNDGYIAIDLYNKKMWPECEDKPIYGSFGIANIRYVDNHFITQVISINDNTAIIISECDYGGATWKGKLTYNATTKTMSYENIEIVNKDEDTSEMCYAASLKLRKVK